MTTALGLPEEYPQTPDRAILVVPHAGGGAAVANPLRALAPPSWLVAGVMFGGRESRFADSPPGSLEELVADTVVATTALRDLAGRPVTLIGQCSGALLAWLAAVRLADRPDMLDTLAVLSRPAPSWPGELPDTSADDETFGKQVAAMGGVPADVGEMPELMELLLPSLRADFTALAQWSAADAATIAPVTVPVLALHAEGDTGCPEEAVHSWASHAGDLQVTRTGGHHFLLGEVPGQVLEHLTARRDAPGHPSSTDSPPKGTDRAGTA